MVWRVIADLEVGSQRFRKKVFRNKTSAKVLTYTYGTSLGEPHESSAKTKVIREHSNLKVSMSS